MAIKNYFLEALVYILIASLYSLVKLSFFITARVIGTLVTALEDKLKQDVVHPGYSFLYLILSKVHNRHTSLQTVM
uniref:Uncharacterized protein n=1 Tax=Lepeophtheirus salmonis TaxID=72036 RepID=A0A0K2TGW1_LEPSM